MGHSALAYDMAKLFSILALYAAAALFVSGCAAPVSMWKHPRAAEEQWSIDKAGCRSRARHLSEKTYRAENYGGAIRDDEFTSAYDQNMQAFTSRRNRQDDYENCLKRLGYTPVDGIN